MKTLIIAIATILATSNAMADSKACNIRLGVKSETAKNAKINGVSFSAKQLEALKTVCNVETELMSDEELVADFKASLQRKHERQAKNK